VLDSCRWLCFHQRIANRCHAKIISGTKCGQFAVVIGVSSAGALRHADSCLQGALFEVDANSGLGFRRHGSVCVTRDSASRRSCSCMRSRVTDLSLKSAYGRGRIDDLVTVVVAKAISVPCRIRNRSAISTSHHCAEVTGLRNKVIDVGGA